MNFTINRNLFIQYLNIVSLGLPSKTPMRLLEGIKIEALEDKITLTTTSSEVSVSIDIKDPSIIIKEQGKTVVIGKVFIELVKAFDTEDISLFLIEDKSLMLKACRKEYLVNIMDVNDYPLIDFIKQEESFDIKSDLFNEIIGQTVFACASNNNKQPVLNGLQFKYDNNKVMFTATNTFRLSQKELDYESDYPNFNVTIPAKALELVQKVIDYSNVKDINIYFNNNKILFKFENILFQTRLLDGNYPNTQNIIPHDPKSTICFIKDELLTALNRTALLSPSEKTSDREITYAAISFKVNKDNEVELSSANAQGNGKEIVIPTSMNLYEPLLLGVSCKYLVEALKAIPSNEVVFGFINSARQFTIKAKDDDSLTELILPFSLD